MSDSIWKDEGIERKVMEILTSVPCKEHHFGRPFVTAYQLAIEFKRRFPQTVQVIGLPLGGAGTGKRSSLASYLAGQISLHYSSMPHVEGAFLLDAFLEDMTFTDTNGAVIKSSSIGWDADLSMFRYVEHRANCGCPGAPRL